MSLSKRRILVISNGAEKQQTYKTLVNRYTLAIEKEFYFEALLITYAMLEDRLRSYLYHMGVIQQFEDSSPNIRKSKSLLRKIYFGSKEAAFNKKINFNRIHDKLTMIQKMAEWAQTDIDEEDTSKYAEILHNVLTELDLEMLLSTLEKIQEWLFIRNEIIHGAFNKNIESLSIYAKEQAKSGMAFVRIIDNCVDKLKGKRDIRLLMRFNY